MRSLIIFVLFFALFSCKEKSNQVTINGHVWNKAENTHFAGAKIVLQEYDNAIEANSKIVSSAYADDQGNFSFNFSSKKSKSYSVFVEVDANNLIVSGLTGAELIESISFNGSNPPSQIELSAATKSFLKANLIKDLGYDSLYFFYGHQFLNFTTSKMYTNEEIEGIESETQSGNWIYKTTRYLGGTPTVSIDTHYLAPNQHQVINVHY